MIDTWYSRSLEEPALQLMDGDCSADVCIVGAGLAGLTTALELSRAWSRDGACGAGRVVVLEARRAAWGASGRNGGFVSPGYAQNHAAIARRVGMAQANTLHAMSIEGMQQVAENIRLLDIHDAQPVDGMLSVRRYPAKASLQRLRDSLNDSFGYQLQYMDRSEVRSRLHSDRYHEALHDPNAFHINPLAYARGLVEAIRGAGHAVHEQSPVETIDGGEGEWRLRTARGEVRARHVIVATGGYTGTLIPQLQRSYLPIATYVMLTEPDEALIDSAVQSNWAILDDRRASDYYRRVDGGRRLLWGGRITTRISEPRALSRLLYQSMISTYPQLEPLAVELAWSGLMSYARHCMPQIGRLPSGLWYCTAFGGHGLSTTAIAGRIVAEAILDRSDRYRHFAPFGLDYTGGVVGRAAVQATYWRYRLMDAWRERA